VASPPSKARLFVALDLPEAAREALVAWRGWALEHPDLRLLAPEALHVTLVFLGHLPEEDIPRIAAALPRDAGAPALRAVGVKPVPPRQPRLFALDLADDEGGAAAIQASVAGGLEALGLYQPEKRPFWPHVTLARVRKGARVRRLELPDPPSGHWLGEAVTLYRSRLSPKGARYEPLERVRLPVETGE
jgi:RNA 2',3'-cyclic 3'-phosphodiesterase